MLRKEKGVPAERTMTIRDGENKRLNLVRIGFERDVFGTSGYSESNNLVMITMYLSIVRKVEEV